FTLSPDAWAQRILPGQAPRVHIQRPAEDLVDPGPLAPIAPMDEYRGQKVIITGDLGFIGSNLAVRLVQNDSSLCLLDTLHPSSAAKNSISSPGGEHACRSKKACHARLSTTGSIACTAGSPT